MADYKNRYEDNVPGAFFVDKNCIYCGLCAELAPKNFRLSEQKDHDIVYQQPATPAEKAACLLALETCPVEAIGQLEVLVDAQPDLQPANPAAKASSERSAS